MKSRIRKLAILLCLLVTLILAPSPRTQANNFACDLDYNAGSEQCVNNYVLCLFQGGTNCSLQYQSCIAGTRDAHGMCEAIAGDPPPPLPVIDERLSWCMEGCQPCWDIETFAERSACIFECREGCMDTYPKP